jgi:hypothetical protein
LDRNLFEECCSFIIPKPDFFVGLSKRMKNSQYKNPKMLLIILKLFKEFHEDIPEPKLTKSILRSSRDMLFIFIDRISNSDDYGINIDDMQKCFIIFNNLLHDSDQLIQKWMKCILDMIDSQKQFQKLLPNILTIMKLNPNFACSSIRQSEIIPNILARINHSFLQISEPFFCQMIRFHKINEKEFENI